jgi:hypothetical protein
MRAQRPLSVVKAVPLWHEVAEAGVELQSAVRAGI